MSNYELCPLKRELVSLLMPPPQENLFASQLPPPPPPPKKKVPNSATGETPRGGYFAHNSTSIQASDSTHLKNFKVTYTSILLSDTRDKSTRMQ